MATKTRTELKAEGFYRFCATTGLITLVAAGTASAGHIFAARWSATTKVLALMAFKATWNTIAGFTTAQEVGLDLFVARSYSASHTGGTAVDSTAAGGFELRTAYPASAFGAADIRIATTGALTAGTQTLDAVPMAANQYAELAAAATVGKGRFCVEWNSSTRGKPLILAANEGLVLRNQILMGAAGTARVNVEMEWAELRDGNAY